MRARHRAFLALLTLGAARDGTGPLSCAAGTGSWSLQLLGGGALNLTTPLTLRQEGERRIRFDARYRTESLSGDSPYYAVRLARWDGHDGWELELLHHKLRLANLPPEVERFAVSHGYNFLFLNRGFRGRGEAARIGLGPVFAHPESTVRGRARAETGGTFGRGTWLAGGGLQAAAEKRVRLAPFAYGSIELKLTAAFARVKIAGGDADVPNVAVHALGGLGLGR